MKKLFLFYLFTLSTFFSFAQVTVQGKITDEKNVPQPYVSVALIAAKDSNLIKGALTESETSRVKVE